MSSLGGTLSILLATAGSASSFPARIPMPMIGCVRRLSVPVPIPVPIPVPTEYRYVLYRLLYVSHSAFVEVAVGLLSLNIVCCVCKSHIASFGREIAELLQRIAGSRSRNPPAASRRGKGLCMDQPQTMEI